MKDENRKNQVKLDDQELCNISGGTAMEMSGEQTMSLSAKDLGRSPIVCAIGETGVPEEVSNTVRLTGGLELNNCVLGTLGAHKKT